MESTWQRVSEGIAALEEADLLQPESLNEADTCRKYVTPRLQATGWEAGQHSLVEQYTFTAGRIVVRGSKARRKPGKRADYLLRYTRDFPIAVVEAKAEDLPAAQGIEQAKEYADVLGLSFAYATNGKEVIEFDYLAGTERSLSDFPTPNELWQRLRAAGKVTDASEAVLLAPSYHHGSGAPRYYQEIAINRVLEAILGGNRRVLITLATGTGKTQVAFQVAWKLWSARWNRAGDHRRPRILFLADRTVLVDDPREKMFAPLGSARHKIEGKAETGREIYFATYQSLAGDEQRAGLYREFAPDFFDLVIVDEAHRGSARDDSSWRDILDHFAPAYQLGMTATPLRRDNRDTYAYFGNPVYTYSLKQGIDDGFLAPYRVFRVQTVWDEIGFRPGKGRLDRYGQEVPDELYKTRDFERTLVLQARTEALARHLTHFLKQTDRFAKTIVFCADQEHALAMRQALVNENSDLVKIYPNYVCRVTADEGDIGRAHLSRFQEVDTRTPTILTTSQLLTTGVDAPTCKNVVLVRPIDSMVEFKQIIGRGTRVREDYGKLFFNILDYAGSASERFADPEFDGDAALLTDIELDEHGEAMEEQIRLAEVQPEYNPDAEEADQEDDEGEADETGGYQGSGRRKKYYVDGGYVQIASEIVQELDADGNVLRVMKLTDYTADKVRTLCATQGQMQQSWSDPARRGEIVGALEERGIDFEELARLVGTPDADPFDVLCHLAYNAPLLTRRERAAQLKRARPGFFDQYGPTARAILEDLLDKYAEHGAEQFKIPDVLKVPPISRHGTVPEIIRAFGGAENLKGAVQSLQTLIYAPTQADG
jgi:type I restriction enzyme R subunit